MVDDALAKSLSAEGPIVFYDGDCGLCDRSIKALIKLDKGHRLRYATLQGETAVRWLGPLEGEAGGWSVKLLDERGVHDRSTAALRAIAATGGVKRAALALLLIPRFLRDGVYRWIATHRYRWFGKVDQCMLPSPALRKRFLP